jgi:hypothetical protein
MSAWLRWIGDRITWTVPAQEPAALPRLEALAGVDIRLAELAGIPPWARTAEHWDELDRLLDRRMRLTDRLVPVIPGGSS